VGGLLYTGRLKVRYCTVVLFYRARILVRYSLEYSELAISLLSGSYVRISFDMWKRGLSVLYLFCLVLQ